MILDTPWRHHNDAVGGIYLESKKTFKNIKYFEKDDGMDQFYLTGSANGLLIAKVNYCQVYLVSSNFIA